MSTCQAFLAPFFARVTKVKVSHSLSIGKCTKFGKIRKEKTSFSNSKKVGLNEPLLGPICKVNIKIGEMDCQIFV